MNSFVLLFVLLNLCISMTVGQFYGSGFYQGGYSAAGFSPFGFQQNPFFGPHTNVHYHAPAGGYYGGYYGGRGGGFGGLGIGTRDVASGAVGFLLGSVLNRNNGK